MRQLQRTTTNLPALRQRARTLCFLAPPEAPAMSSLSLSEPASLSSESPAAGVGGGARPALPAFRRDGAAAAPGSGRMLTSSPAEPSSTSVSLPTPDTFCAWCAPPARRTSAEMVPRRHDVNRLPTAAATRRNDIWNVR